MSKMAPRRHPIFFLNVKIYFTFKKKVSGLNFESIFISRVSRERFACGHSPVVPDDIDFQR